MPKFLLIDTSQKNASVALTENEHILSVKENTVFGSHEAWLHTAIQFLFTDTKIEIKNIDAVAISIGPGSYTGLRIGLATAKGLCYALQKPLIAVDTLKMMAQAAVKQNNNANFFCPMIDARRMEVFTALLDKQLNFIHPSQALILTNDLWKKEIAENKILFFGTGAEKIKPLYSIPNAVFEEVSFNATHLLEDALKHYNEKRFANLANIEPNYLKEFYTNAIQK